MSHRGVQSRAEKEKDGEEEGEEETDGGLGVEGGLVARDHVSKRGQKQPPQQQQQQHDDDNDANNGALHEAFLDPVTLSLLERPVTLTCGHNVSKPVLKEMRRVGLKRCPSCQAETVGTSGRLQVNLLLERTIESLFPGQVPRPSMEELRREQLEEEAEERALSEARARRAVQEEEFGPHTDWTRLCGAEVSLPASLYEPENQPCCTALAFALAHQRPPRLATAGSLDSASSTSSSGSSMSMGGRGVGGGRPLGGGSSVGSSSSSSSSSSDDDEEEEGSLLEVLDLAHTCVGPAGIMALCGALLSGVMRVEQLVLAGSGITDQSVLALVEALRTKAARGEECCMTSDIFRFCIRGKQVTDVGVLAMVRAISTDSSLLDDLRLDSETLTDAALVQLSKALRSGRCPYVSFLNLAGRGLSSGLVEVAKAMAGRGAGKSAGPCKLEALSLPDMYGAATMRDVAGLLRTSRGRDVRRIVLHASQMSETGARALVRSLSSPSCPALLWNLIVSDISVSDKGALALADLISSGACPGLKTVCLRDATDGDRRLVLLEKITRAQWYSRKPPLLQRRTSPRLQAVLEQQHVRVEEGETVEKGVGSMALLTDEVLLSAVQDQDIDMEAAGTLHGE